MVKDQDKELVQKCKDLKRAFGNDTPMITAMAELAINGQLVKLVAEMKKTNRLLGELVKNADSSETGTGI